jgi:hypothetical protein
LRGDAPLDTHRAWTPGPAFARAFLAACGFCLLAALARACEAVGLPFIYLQAGGISRDAVEALALGAIALAAAVPRAFRTRSLVGLSALAYPLCFGWRAVFVAAFCLLVCALARGGLRLRHQLAIALVAWALLPVGRWVLAARSPRALPVSLMMVWAALAYSAIYLLVERARQRRVPPLADDLFYLVAPPRLLCPFSQPISPSHLYQHEGSEVTTRHVARGVLLGVYAMALGVGTVPFRHWVARPHSPLVAIPAEIVAVYFAFGKTIFIAVSLFRLMGFDISSGMRQPFLATSFADYFSRFNHYVRDAVLSLFFIPLFVSLRRRMSPRVAAVIAGYVSIVVGSFLLNQLLVPVSTSLDWRTALKTELDPSTLLVMALYWSAIVLPSASFDAGPRRPARSRSLQVVRFLAIYVLFWTAGWFLRNWHHPWS